MGSNSPVPNQVLKQIQQDFDIDIHAIYADFIQEIDANRSIININTNKSSLTFFNIKTIASIISTLVQTGESAQESRAHAFYRLVGFPVISAGMKYYNPGLDTVEGAKSITLTNKIDIANDPIAGFNALSLMRENYTNTISQIFSVQPTTISATALALTSGPFLARTFATPVTSISPFDMTASTQGYTPNLNSIVGGGPNGGGGPNVLVTNYMDALGNTPTSNSDTTALSLLVNGTSGPSRYHFIKPFIVDARIDFTTNPSSRRIGIPFVPTKQNLLVSNGVYVERPLIEKVVRDLFNPNQNVVLSPAQQSYIQYILNVQTVKNDSVISQVTSGSLNNPIASAQFQKYLYIIVAMCTRLVEAQSSIQIVQGRYYWLPLPSSSGPEGGVGISDPIVSSTLPANFITNLDQGIINFILSQTLSNFNNQTAATNAVPSLGTFAFDKFKTFDVDTTAAYGNNTNDELTRALKLRTHDMNIAGTALQTIETIMGEWSGLGLCDIVAVMGAFYIMPANDVLGFLDQDALARAVSQGVITAGDSASANISTAQTSFLNYVNVMYHLMDDIYQDIYQNSNKAGIVSK